jgi:ABC-type lipoprotein export system ATPase subunit
MITSELTDSRRCNIIRVANVSKIYRGDGVEYRALRNIDLNIDEGEFIAVVGESGCGKSTLLNILAGIDCPSEGEIYVGDQPLHRMRQE